MSKHEATLEGLKEALICTMIAHDGPPSIVLFEGSGLKEIFVNGEIDWSGTLQTIDESLYYSAIKCQLMTINNQYML